MISSIIIDGALKLVQIMRYGNTSNRPDVARIYNPREAVPEKVLECSKYDNTLFSDPLSGQQFKEVKGTLVPIH